MDGRAHQRVVERERVLVEPDQPGALGGLQVGSIGLQGPGGREQRAGVAGVVHRGDEQHGAGGLGQAPDPLHERHLHRGADGQRVRQRRAPGQLVGGEQLRQLLQRQGVATGARDQLPPDLGCRLGPARLGQHLQGRLEVEPVEVEGRQVRGDHRPAGAGAGDGDGTRGDHEGDGFGQEAARQERQRVGRLLVEPVGVVDHAQQRSLLGHLGQEAQHGQRDQEPVGPDGVAQAEGALQRLVLGRRDPGQWPSTGWRIRWSAAKGSVDSDSTPRSRSTRKPAAPATV